MNATSEMSALENGCSVLGNTRQVVMTTQPYAHYMNMIFLKPFSQLHASRIFSLIFRKIPLSNKPFCNGLSISTSNVTAMNAK